MVMRYYILSILIDCFVNAVYLYDDRVVLTFNYKDGGKTVTLQEIEGSDLFVLSAVIAEARFLGNELFSFLKSARNQSGLGLFYFVEKWYAIIRCMKINTRWRSYDAFGISEKRKTMGRCTFPS